MRCLFQPLRRVTISSIPVSRGVTTGGGWFMRHGVTFAGQGTGLRLCGVDVEGPSADPRVEPIDFYKISRVSVETRQKPPATPPPWHGVAPAIEVYRDRGRRRLAPRTYASVACSSCIWGARMPVEIIIDHWNPDQKPIRDLLLWAQVLPPLPPGSHSEGSGAPRHDLRGGRLGRCRGHSPSPSRRLTPPDPW